MSDSESNIFKNVVFVSKKQHSFFDPYINAVCDYGDIESSFIFSPTSQKDLNENIYDVVNDRNATCLFICGEYVINKILLEKLSKLFLIRLGGDDDMFFDVYTKDISNYFDVNLTTSHWCHSKMLEMGVNSILIPSMYKSNQKYPKCTEKYDVSFCGAMDTKHGRNEYLGALLDDGVNTHLFGRGTSNGYLDRDEMFELYLDSKINLNFSGVDSNKDYISKISSMNLIERKQLKGRIFEIMHQGGFVLTEDCPDIKYFFTPGVDLVTFKNKDELVKLVHYYLGDNEARELIRNNGYKSVQKHSYKVFAPKVVKNLLSYKKTSQPIYGVSPKCSKYVALVLANDGIFFFKPNFSTSASYGYSTAIWYCFFYGRLILSKLNIYFKRYILSFK